MSAEEPYPTQYLAFSPELECFYCKRYTHIAILNFPGLQPLFQPVCPLHGYLPAQEDREMVYPHPSFEEQVKGVIRFVVWTQGNCGTVPVVEPVEDVNAIPGYIRYKGQDWDDEGWHVEYVSPGGERKEMWVTYGIEDDMFWLMENGNMWNYGKEKESRTKRKGGKS